MWNFSFLKLHVSVETFLSIYLSMVCLHTDLAESYPYFPQVGISLGKCSPIIFTTSWTCYCFWKDSMAGETQASCNCSHKVGTVSPQTIFLFPGLVCPTQKLKTFLVFSSLELLMLPGMVWNLGTRNNWPMLVFNLVCFFYPNEAVTNWCTLMSSGEEKHGALKKQKCVWFCIVKCQVKTPDTITALSRKISLVRWQLLRWIVTKTSWNTWCSQDSIWGCLLWTTNFLYFQSVVLLSVYNI